jgi:serine/threonine protein kinase
VTLQPGARFAGYTIGRLLGVGGMGEVYLADHPNLPKQDALKVLAGPLCTNDAFRQRFLVEANLACRLRHPNIVGILDRGEYEGRLWIAMDYIDGRNLDDALKQDGPFPLSRALRVMAGITSAVQDLHDNNLLHRDIKPANIMLASRPSSRGEEQAYLTDFGIARDAADTLGLTATTQTVLTLAYAAPERLSMPSAQLDRRVDVFSLGCVFYEMITGRRAFPGTDSRQLLHQLMDEYPPPASRLVPGIPEVVDRAIYQAIAKNRDDRFSNCMDFQKALESAIHDTAPVVRPEPPLSIWYRGEDMAPIELHTDRLSRYDSDRLVKELWESVFFHLDPMLPSASWQGGRRELALQASNGTKTVGWQGQPPLAVQSLCRTVEDIARGGAAGTGGTSGVVGTVGAPGAVGTGGTVPQPGSPKKSRKRWVIGGTAAAVVIAGVVVAVLVLTKPGKPPIPAVPANVTAAALPGAIKVTWLPSENADHYVLFRDNSVLKSDLRTTTFTDPFPTDMKSHSYSVVAVSIKDKESAHSAVVKSAAKLRDLNSTETALVKRLPVGLTETGSCTPDLTVEDSSVDAAVDCDPKAATGVASPSQKVLAYHSVNKAAFDTDVKNGESGLQTAKFNCQTGVPSAGTWTHNSETAGAFYCFITNDSSANSAVAWTTSTNLDTLVIYNRAGSGRPGIAALYKYWAAVPNHETT